MIEYLYFDCKIQELYRYIYAIQCIDISVLHLDLFKIFFFPFLLKKENNENKRDIRNDLCAGNHRILNIIIINFQENYNVEQLFLLN